MAPVLLPYFLRAMKVSANPAIKGEIMYMMLKPNITRFQTTQRTADPKPATVPINMAISAQRFTYHELLLRDDIKFSHL